MPRAGWVKPRDDQRLSDHVALGVLTRTFPPELVDAVVTHTGRRQQRSRLLPARLVAYYVMAMTLFSSSGYEEVMRSLVEGLSWESGWRQAWSVPSQPAISQARACLHALSSTQSAIRSEIDDVFTTGMKCAGETRPRSGWRQRINASAPISPPSMRRTCG